MTTSEVAEELKISRQRLNAIVKEREIIPFKQTPNVNLFLKADVMNYKKMRGNKMENRDVFEEPFLFDQSSSTRQSVEFFKEQIGKMGRITKIFAFFKDIDAVLEGFYLPSLHFQSGPFLMLNSPGVVLVDEYDREMWLNSCNCGYGGTGPHGTADILKALGVPEEEIEPVFYHRIVKYFRENDKFVVQSRQSDYDFGIDYDLGTLRVYYHSHLKNLVLLHEKYRYSGTDRDIENAILERCKSFIPNPIEVTIYPTFELAEDHGYCYGSSYEKEYYQVIIRDKSGRELWLDPYVDEVSPINEQENLISILDRCGFKIPTKNKTKQRLEWLYKTLNNKQPEPITITEKKQITINY